MKVTYNNYFLLKLGLVTEPEWYSQPRGEIFQNGTDGNRRVGKMVMETPLDKQQDILEEIPLNVYLINENYSNEENFDQEFNLDEIIVVPDTQLLL